jgi:hypothetical protein
MKEGICLFGMKTLGPAPQSPPYQSGTVLTEADTLTLSIRAEYIYSAASQATSLDGVYILRNFHKVVKWPGTVDFKWPPDAKC